MKTPLWTSILGIASILPALYFWLWMVSPSPWLASYPGKPGAILIAIVCSIPLSTVAAIRGSRLWHAVTAVSVLTLLFVGLRLH
jgi:hypothetical protein